MVTPAFVLVFQGHLDPVGVVMKFYEQISAEACRKPQALMKYEAGIK